MTRGTSKSQKKKALLQNYCQYCGQQFDKKKKLRTFDHFYPLYLGQNLNRTWNKFVVCQPCNWDKKDKMPKDFIVWLLKRVKNMDPQSVYFTRASRTITNILLILEKIEVYFEAKDIL